MAATGDSLIASNSPPMVSFNPRESAPDDNFSNWVLAQPDCHYAFIQLSSAKLDAHLRKDRVRYVGPGGGDSAKVFKHEGVQAIIDLGEPMVMPILMATASRDEAEFLRTVHVTCGRHRLYGLYKNGELPAKVAVPSFQAALFLKHFA